MRSLLAIDGSLNCVGIAYFVDGRLIQTWAFKWGRRSRKVNIATRAYQLAVEAQKALGMAVDEVVYEFPQAYGDEKNPNDLFGIVAVSAHIASLCEAHEVTSYYPREWTVGIKKTDEDGKLLQKNVKTSARAKRIRLRLDGPAGLECASAFACERDIFDRASTYDEIDAIGIGLHHLDRGINKPNRVYPGAV